MSGRAARLTPPGVGGLHVFGLAGDGVDDFLAACFVSRSTGDLRHGHLVDGDELVDEALVRRAGSGRADVSVHGSIAVTARLERLLADRGFELVSPWTEDGEWTVHREAREALARAFAAETARRLASAMDGRLERAVAAAAAAADVAALATLLADAPFGEALCEAPAVVLAGPPNAGKSTLFNRLLRRERVITAPEPGTTRDVVEAAAELAGFPFRLADTAGAREPAEPVEAAGIARAAAARRRADLVVTVEAADAEEDGRGAAGEGVLTVINKIDLLDAAGRTALAARRPGALLVSAARGEGVDDLVAAIIARTPFGSAPPAGAAFPFTRRQSAALRAALAAFPDDPARARLALDTLVR